MIVAPDFFDHWRTRMLVDALGGAEMAPLPERTASSEAMPKRQLSQATGYSAGY